MAPADGPGPIDLVAADVQPGQQRARPGVPDPKQVARDQRIVSPVRRETQIDTDAADLKAVEQPVQPPQFRAGRCIIQHRARRPERRDRQHPTVGREPGRCAQPCGIRAGLVGRGKRRHGCPRRRVDQQVGRVRDRAVDLGAEVAHQRSRAVAVDAVVLIARSRPAQRPRGDRPVQRQMRPGEGGEIGVPGAFGQPAQRRHNCAGPVTGQQCIVRDAGEIRAHLERSVHFRSLRRNGAPKYRQERRENPLSHGHPQPPTDAPCGLPARRPWHITPAMTPVFDIDDHARLPWRFFGKRRAVTGRL
jgi:hypothetical protein